jgi:hypothetical protein
VDDSDESTGEGGAAPRQPTAGSEVRRKAAAEQPGPSGNRAAGSEVSRKAASEQPGASGSRSAGKVLAHKRKRAAPSSSADLPPRPKKIQWPKKVPESVG